MCVPASRARTGEECTSKAIVARRTRILMKVCDALRITQVPRRTSDTVIQISGGFQGIVSTNRTGRFLRLA
jgi:hypothetical protein